MEQFIDITNKGRAEAVYRWMMTLVEHYEFDASFLWAFFIWSEMIRIICKAAHDFSILKWWGDCKSIFYADAVCAHLSRDVNLRNTEERVLKFRGFNAHRKIISVLFFLRRSIEHIAISGAFPYHLQWSTSGQMNCRISEVILLIYHLRLLFPSVIKDWRGWDADAELDLMNVVESCGLLHLQSSCDVKAVSVVIEVLIIHRMYVPKYLGCLICSLFVLCKFESANLI